MKKEMLINVMQPEECRIAIVEDGVLQELYVERMNQESYVNNIYKGKVVNLEPSIQAAFVDFGIGRNGFLHVSDVASAYFRSGERSERGGGGERRDDRGGGGRHGERPPSRRFEPVEIPSGPAPIEEAVPPEFAEEAPAVEEEYYDDGFGAGLDFEDTPHAGTIIAAPGVDVGEVEEDIIAEIIDSPPANELDVKWDSDADSDSETDEASESGEPAEEGGEKPKRRRSAKGKPRRPGDPKAAKKKPVKKKPDDDDKPKYQGSAEHRTTIDDEFFFDPSGPNDRFADESQPAAQGDEAPADFAPDEPSQEPESAEFSDPDAGLANNFAAPEDQWEDGPPPSYNRDRDRGGRDDRGGRGGRDDRGGRGGRGGRDGRGDRGGRGGRDGRSGSDTERRSGSGGGGFGRGRDGGMRPPPIESIFKRGQEVIVQVIKEGMGTKGPTLSTHISIAGRYLVLAPWLNRVAVSRKITDEGTRHRLKEIMAVK